MPFPPPPPPPPPPRRWRGDDLDEPSAARLSLRPLRLYSPGRTAAPIQHHHALRLPTSSEESYASVVRRGVSHTQHRDESRSESESEFALDSTPLIIKKIPVDQKPRTPTSPSAGPPPSIDVVPAGKPKLNLTYYSACLLPTSSQESSASVLHRDESEFELDSPPRIIIMKMPVDQEPRTPTSPPPGSPSSIDVEPAGLPTFGSDTEEWYFSDGEDDLYFKSLVDNFVTTVCSSEDKIDEKADYRRQTDEYAESALKYYNNDKNNKVKYDLIRVIVTCGMVDVERCYAHMNFIAKGNQEHSKEELFFAEIRLDTILTPTSVLSLEGVEKVGGLRESKYDRYYDGEGLPIADQHCYACRSKVLHPKNGALYESGHVAFSGFYHLMGN